MFERGGCGWCIAWHAEIGPIYPKTPEGQALGLRRVDLDRGLPEDLKGIPRVVFTPTFVLFDHGREIGRITGYAGPDMFWDMLAGLMMKLERKERRGGP